ncbi:hypothetical protein B0H17DRAFT_1192465 [Mycena rosella]|uniref:F-box domain-containing protein n=1 Tax=Mycena rosella TaxID=1033263 RepID=A0AAD7GWR5_MYCRO|nr:hypothetical protein B0H17DRAFT_1192465 [Mycena rosella]
MISSFALGPLTNREPHYQNQHTLITDEYGRLRFAAISRRVLALPPEVLAEIFLHCLPDDEFIKPDIISSPLVLCGICHHFREIVLSTPGLWSSLSFETESAPDAESIELVRSWLARARRVPLSLRFHNSNGDWESASAQSILQIIVSLFPQWRNIELDLTLSLGQIIFPLGREFPLLEKLAFITCGEHGPKFMASLYIDAPKLRQISARIYHIVSLHIPWDQITVYRMTCSNFRTCIQILPYLLNLVNGTFEVDRYNSPTEPISVPPLLRLQSLTVVGSGRSVPMHILDYFTAPALKTLTLRFPHYRPMVASETAPLISFASRSSFQLHTMSLSLVLTADAVVQCLEALPSLAHLKIMIEPLRADYMSAVFRQLTGIGEFLPKLESLHAILTNLSPFESQPQPIGVGVLTELLHWRRTSAGITQLKSFQLVYDCNTLFDRAVDSDLEEFRPFSAEGMQLYVGPLRPSIDDY